MNQKKTLTLILILLLGAACFGGGVLFGQHILMANGFVYGNSATTGTTAETENDSNTTNEDSSAETGEAETILVNINTASYDELLSVNGIGEVTAGKILDARNAAGVFTDTYDLVTYGAMGDARYESVKENLTVD